MSLSIADKIKKPRWQQYSHASMHIHTHTHTLKNLATSETCLE